MYINHPTQRHKITNEHYGEIHILIADRPYSISVDHIKQIARQNIHLHIYGTKFHTRYKELLDKAKIIADDYLHLHDTCSPKDFVKEFSKYDAGFLHFYKRENNNELIRVNWNEINTNKDKVNSIRKNVWNNWEIFSFDYHLHDLIKFFNRVIYSKRY